MTWNVLTLRFSAYLRRAVILSMLLVKKLEQGRREGGREGERERERERERESKHHSTTNP